MSGILQMMGMMQGFNPSSLSPVLWINPYIDNYSTTVDNNGTKQRGNIINSATASTGQSISAESTLNRKAIYNGEGWYFKDQAQMTTGTTSDYNFIHDGSDFDIWCTVFICPTASTTFQRAFICNNGFSTTARGILLRANASNNRRVECNIGNGTSSFITLTANNAITVNATNTIRVTRNGNTARMFVNGTQVATQTISLSPGVGNAAGVMTIAQFLGATANLYFKDLVIFNRALTTDEANKMSARTFASITPTPINVYLLAGDSNCAGRGVNASIAPDLTGNISGSYIPTFTTAYNLETYVEKVLLGKNQTIPSENPSTQHGAEMRFAKNMGANGDVMIIKQGVGSNTIFQRGNSAFADYNVNTTSSTYSRWINSIIPQALSNLVHTQRRTPVFRGFIWTQGANDAIFGAVGATWTRSGTTVTVNSGNHGLTTPDRLGFYDSSDATTIPVGNYSITRIDANTFTFQANNTGATSGTLSYSGGYFYKDNLTAIINGTIDVIQNTVKNEVTNGTGYTVNKLRIYIAKTRSSGSGFKANSIAHVLAAQENIASNYLIDNPSRAVNVLGLTIQETDSLPMLDSLHYSTAGYDTLGSWEMIYFNNYINE